MPEYTFIKSEPADVYSWFDDTEHRAVVYTVMTALTGAEQIQYTHRHNVWYRLNAFGGVLTATNWVVNADFAAFLDSHKVGK